MHQPAPLTAPRFQRTFRKNPKCTLMPLPVPVQKFLQALANENRQRIMLLFSEQPVLTVGAVAERTQLGMSTASEHLKQLKEAGLLSSEKIGKEVEYRANVEQIQTILSTLSKYLNQCC